MKAYQKTLLSIFTCAAFSQATAEEAAVKALYITGGGWHDYELQTLAITETLRTHIPGIEITVSAVESSADAPTMHPAFEGDDWAKGYDLVIYNMCNSGRDSDDDYMEKIVAPHRAGLPAVVIHCAMHQFRPDETGKWNEFVGMDSTAHERGAPVTVTFTEREHPILKGLPETWTIEEGELYRIRAAAENTETLATGVSGEEKAHPIVWTNRYGEGRVFGTTIGHRSSTMGHEEFQLLLKNGTMWALEKDDK